MASWTKPYILILAIILIVFGLINLFVLHGLDFSRLTLSLVGDIVALLAGISLLIRYIIEKKKETKQEN